MHNRLNIFKILCIDNELALHIAMLSIWKHNYIYSYSPIFKPFTEP